MHTSGNSVLQKPGCSASAWLRRSFSSPAKYDSSDIVLPRFEYAQIRVVVSLVSTQHVSSMAARIRVRVNECVDVMLTNTRDRKFSSRYCLSCILPHETCTTAGLAHASVLFPTRIVERKDRQNGQVPKGKPPRCRLWVQSITGRRAQRLGTQDCLLICSCFACAGTEGGDPSDRPLCREEGSHRQEL